MIASDILNLHDRLFAERKANLHISRLLNDAHFIRRTHNNVESSRLCGNKTRRSKGQSVYTCHIDV